MHRVYEIFEVWPDGSTVKRAVVSGLEFAKVKLDALAERKSYECKTVDSHFFCASSAIEGVARGGRSTTLNGTANVLDPLTVVPHRSQSLLLEITANSCRPGIFVGGIGLNGGNSQRLVPIWMKNHDVDGQRPVVLLLTLNEQGAPELFLAVIVDSLPNPYGHRIARDLKMPCISSMTTHFELAALCAGDWVQF